MFSAVHFPHLFFFSYILRFFKQGFFQTSDEKLFFFAIHCLRKILNVCLFYFCYATSYAPNWVLFCYDSKHSPNSHETSSLFKGRTTNFRINLKQLSTVFVLWFMAKVKQIVDSKTKRAHHEDAYMSHKTDKSSKDDFHPIQLHI